MQHVSVGRRFGALLIDDLVSLVWFLPLSRVTKIETPLGSQYSFGLRGWHFVVAVAISLVYFTVLEAAFGATLGKLAVGIRVVGVSGKRIDARQSIARNLARIVDAFPWFFPYLLGAIFVWNSPTRQRLGDRWANTVVIVRGSNEGAAEDSATAWSAAAPAPMGWSERQRGGTPPPLPPPPPGS
ncbi:MAG: RDD family protein [Actinomycetota bacterium]|nr:RDD family protein [Actinomycetota bacterium]